MFSYASFVTSGTSFAAWYDAFPDLSSTVIKFKFVVSASVPHGFHIHLYHLQSLA
jgi:hypothetical protein